MDVGELCTWIQLIIDFIIGPRKQRVADELIEVTDKHFSDSKPLFITDGLKFYAQALLKKYGEWIEFPRTGKRGRPKKPRLMSGKNLRYAQVVKNRYGRRLKKVAKESSSVKILTKRKYQRVYWKDKTWLSDKTIVESQGKQ